MSEKLKRAIIGLAGAILAVAVAAGILPDDYGGETIRQALATILDVVIEDSPPPSSAPRLDSSPSR